jgi:hypothetical protein
LNEWQEKLGYRVDAFIDMMVVIGMLLIDDYEMNVLIMK